MYRKIELRINADAKFRSLSPSGKYLFLSILISKYSCPIPGVINASPSEIAVSLGWPYDHGEAMAKRFGEPFAEPFAELLRGGLIDSSESESLVFVINAIKHNAPANPNIILSWGRYWDCIPEGKLKYKIYQRFHAFFSEKKPSFMNAFHDAIKPLPEPFGEPLPEPGTGTGTVKKEIKKKKTTAKNAAAKGQAQAPDGDIFCSRIEEQKKQSSRIERKESLAEQSRVVTTQAIEFLNFKAKTNFRASAKSTQKLIRTLLSKKYTIEDLKIVISAKVVEWGTNSEMRKFLRPSTLFGSKFEKYRDESDVAPCKLEKEDIRPRKKFKPLRPASERLVLTNEQVEEFMRIAKEADERHEAEAEEKRKAEEKRLLEVN